MPNAPQAQNGIALLVGERHLGQFVGAQIERANHHGLVAHRLITTRIRFEVRLLRWARSRAEIQKLGAIQADAVGAALGAMIDFVGKLDVAHQVDPHAVGRFRRQVAQRFQLQRQRRYCSASCRYRATVSSSGCRITTP